MFLPLGSLVVFSFARILTFVFARRIPVVTVPEKRKQRSKKKKRKAATLASRAATLDISAEEFRCVWASCPPHYSRTRNGRTDILLLGNHERLPFMRSVSYIEIPKNMHHHRCWHALVRGATDLKVDLLVTHLDSLFSNLTYFFKDKNWWQDLDLQAEEHWKEKHKILLCFWSGF